MRECIQNYSNVFIESSNGWGVGGGGRDGFSETENTYSAHDYES